MTHAPPLDQTLADEVPAEGARQGALTIAHFVVLRKLGEGAMGIVYAAYDTRLDRRVALKLVRRDRPERGDSHGRVLREAQGLARLSHPNVVQIYEVGEVGDRLFLAMEYLDGQTLRAWLRERPRSWSAVLATFVAAGRGLAAAHAARLVHRDFKPDNVMVGRDGRVHVMDFGLARPVETAAADTLAEALLSAQDVSLSRTIAGRLIGTPAYMAPEQHLRAPTDARTDQFAFCVALFEGLYGQRPFAGDDLRTLAVHVTSGTIREPPRRGVPRWLRRIVLRGLSVDAADRWPSMDALLDAIERGQRRARLRIAGLALGLGAAAAGAAWTWHRVEHARRADACEAAGASIDAVWDDAARGRVREALLATGVAYAATTADRVMPWLDRQAAAWRSARTEVCMDAELRGRLDAETFDRALWCLDERRIAFESLVHDLARADVQSVLRAIGAAAGLESVDPCRDPASLARSPAPPSDAREQVREAVVMLSRAGNLMVMANYPEALEVARAALARAESAGWPPLVAAARLRVARLIDRTGRHVEAKAEMLEAYFLAAEAGATGVIADAAISMVLFENQLARPADAQTWSRLAAVPLRVLEPEGGLRTAVNYSNLAISRVDAGAFAEAQQLNREALAIRERLLGPDHPNLAISLSNLAIVHYSTGAFAEVGPLFERAAALIERSYGPDHPQFASALNNLASLRFTLGDPAAAAPLFERALAIRERALGPEHPEVAEVLNNLGELHKSLGALAEARPLHERALAIYEARFGPEHPRAARSRVNLADARAAAGELDAARALAEQALASQEKAQGPEHPELAETIRVLANIRALAGAGDEARALLGRALTILETSKGPEHPDLARSLADLGALELAAGRHEEARAAWTRAQALIERAFGRDHVDHVDPLLGLARLALAEQRPADALAPADRATALCERGGVAPEQTAAARFVLAQALWAVGDAQARALELATRARDHYLGAPGEAARLAEVERWLAQRRDEGRP